MFPVTWTSGASPSFAESLGACGVASPVSGHAQQGQELRWAGGTAPFPPGPPRLPSNPPRLGLHVGGWDEILLFGLHSEQSQLSSRRLATGMSQEDGAMTAGDKAPVLETPGSSPHSPAPLLPQRLA